MASWYRRFIKNFSTITSPISDILKKGKKFVWSESANTAFLKLKSLLISPPILANPVFSEQFVIQTDASDVGVGAVLTQGIGENERVVSFFSQKLTTQQRKYHTTEKECLAVILAIERFRPYIEGSHFVVITDHASLLWLNNLNDPSGRLGRWALRLQQYQFDLRHRKGKFNVVPDALSRSMECDIVTINEDDWFQKIKSGLENNPEKYPDFKFQGRQIYKLFPGSKLKLVVPFSQQAEVLQRCHDDPLSAHLGVFKTAYRIKQNYYWPNIDKSVKDYIKNCEVCKASKDGPMIKSPMGSYKSPKEPWNTIAIDYLGPLTRSKSGNNYVLVVIDLFTKFVLLFPLRKADSQSTIKILENQVFLLFGTPKTLISDNGPQFIALQFKKFLKENGVNHFRNANYHPQNNPAERVNRVILSAIRSYVENDHREWDQHINKIACAIRTACHDSTGYTPFYLNFGREIFHYGYLPHSVDVNEPEAEDDPLNNRIKYLKEEFIKIKKIVQDNLLKSYDKYSHYYNLRSGARTHDVGDIVWKRNFQLSNAVQSFSAKLAPKWVKCRIKRKVGSNTYLLENVNGKEVGIFHTKDFKANALS